MGIIEPFLPTLQEIKRIREILFMEKLYIPQIPACTILPYGEQSLSLEEVAAAMDRAPGKSQETWGPLLVELPNLFMS